MLPQSVKERFEQLVASHGGHVRLLGGYGLTKAGRDHGDAAGRSAGGKCRPAVFPHPGCPSAGPGHLRGQPGPEEEGEICVWAPAVMLGYLDNPADTAEVLRRHPDGRIRLHTGDLGRRDPEGFFDFTGRLKRMIKTSGFTVNPVQVGRRRRFRTRPWPRHA